jgi:hypothetical protein
LWVGEDFVMQFVTLELHAPEHVVVVVTFAVEFQKH